MDPYLWHACQWIDDMVPMWRWHGTHGDDKWGCGLGTSPHKGISCSHIGICVTNLGTHISHGECHIPAMEQLLQNGMLHAQSDLELSLCEKSLNLWW